MLSRKVSVTAGASVATPTDAGLLHVRTAVGVSRGLGWRLHCDTAAELELSAEAPNIAIGRWYRSGVGISAGSGAMA